MMTAKACCMELLHGDSFSGVCNTYPDDLSVLAANVCRFSYGLRTGLITECVNETVFMMYRG